MGGEREMPRLSVLKPSVAQRETATLRRARSAGALAATARLLGPFLGLRETSAPALPLESRSVARSRTIGAAISILALLVTVVSSCGSTKHASTTTTIAAPSYTVTQQNNYFRDLVDSDASISPYITQHARAALDALLAYGAGFCALLADGEDPSTAISNLQTQATNTQSKTGFSGSQTTYETIATDSLIVLCPSEQKVLTQTELAQLKAVEHSLPANS
jgi:hypothetical protein